MAVHAAMIDNMDQNIGRLVKCLENIGRLNNTIIIFLSDNGGSHERVRNIGNYIKSVGPTGNPDSFDSYEYPWANVSNTPFRMHKHWVHEGGISTPFILFYPNLEIKTSLIKTPGHIIDIMPTLLDFADEEYLENYENNSILSMEGISLLPALQGQSLKRDNPLFWEHEGNRAVLMDDWKLVSAYDYLLSPVKK